MLDSYKIDTAKVSERACGLLMGAITAQTKNDYVRALMKLEQNPEDYTARERKKECELFFVANAYGWFTETEGKNIIEKIKKEAAMNVKRRMRKRE